MDDRLYISIYIATAMIVHVLFIILVTSIFNKLVKYLLGIKSS